jgi:cytochrome bd-type quinol oxidase subunit 1
METAADLVFLSRLQFALTTSFHILFPEFDIFGILRSDT